MGNELTQVCLKYCCIAKPQGFKTYIISLPKQHFKLT